MLSTDGPKTHSREDSILPCPKETTSVLSNLSFFLLCGAEIPISRGENEAHIQN